MRNDLFRILKSFFSLNRNYYMYTSTAQCFSGKMILYSHLKCDGNESHSIRMLKRHLLLNSQTHTTTTRTTLRMFQFISVYISVLRMYQCSKKASEHDGAELHSPLSQDGGDPSGAGHGSVSGKTYKKIFTCVQSLCTRANYHSFSTRLQNRG